MKFSIKNFFSKCDQIRSLLWIWPHLPKKIPRGKLHFLCSDTKWSECGNISGVLCIYWFFSLGKSFLKLCVTKSKAIFKTDHWSLWTICCGQILHVFFGMELHVRAFRTAIFKTYPSICFYSNQRTLGYRINREGEGGVLISRRAGTLVKSKLGWEEMEVSIK